MNSPLTRSIPVKGAYNVRDLGGYPIADSETLWRRVLRADALHRLDADDVALLIDAGVATVIDLRHDNELAEQPNPLAGHPAVSYHNVSLFADLAPTVTPGEDALLALYLKALDERGETIARVLTLIAEAKDGAVLFHCTAGKDSTGVIAALLLTIAGVETALIVEDYALTAQMIEPMIDELVEGARARGIDPERFMPFLASEPQTMALTIAHIETTHGSVAAYLRSIGLSDTTIARLRARLAGD